LSWFGAWQSFAEWMGVRNPEPDQGYTVALPTGQRLILGWAKGDLRFLSM
jgi:hypothetical protein